MTFFFDGICVPRGAGLPAVIITEQVEFFQNGMCFCVPLPAAANFEKPSVRIGDIKYFRIWGVKLNKNTDQIQVQQ